MYGDTFRRSPNLILDHSCHFSWALWEVTSVDYRWFTFQRSPNLCWGWHIFKSYPSHETLIKIIQTDPSKRFIYLLFPNTSWRFWALLSSLHLVPPSQRMSLMRKGNSMQVMLFFSLPSTFYISNGAIFFSFSAVAFTMRQNKSALRYAWPASIMQWRSRLDQIGG